MNAKKKVNAILEGKNIRKVISESVSLETAVEDAKATENVHQELTSLHKAAYRLSDIIDDKLNLKGVYSPAKIGTDEDDNIVLKFGPVSDEDSVLTEEDTNEETIVDFLTDLKDVVNDEVEDYDLEVAEIDLIPSEESELEPVKIEVTDEGEVEVSNEEVEVATDTEETLEDVPEEIVIKLEGKKKAGRKVTK